MKKKSFLLVLGIIVLGMILRLRYYTVYPQRGATSDEYTYSFLGLSLLTRGQPVSWSFFSYPNRQDLTIDNLYFPLVWPYFDHPPLNGLLVGGWALLNGQNTFEKIQLPTIRQVSIALAVLSSILVFLLAERLFNYQIALWALLIYSTATIVAVQQRVVLAENLLTPLWLGTLYLYLRFQKALSAKRVLVLAFLSGLAIWTKELGISVFISLFILMLLDKIKPSIVRNFTAVVGLFILGYLAYGAYYGWEQFVKITTVQGSREVGPETLWYILSTPVIINKVYYDGWYFFGFLSMFMLWSRFLKFRLINLPSLVYFLLLLVTLTRQGQSGWYLLPLFPFMAIASAKALVDSLTSQGWFVFLPLIFTGMTLVQYLFEPSFGLAPIQFRLLTAILVAPFLVLLFMRQRQAVRWSWLGFYLFILGNIILTYTYRHP